MPKIIHFAKVALTVSVLVCLSAPVRADDSGLDPASTDALQKTVQDLKSSSNRAVLVKQDPQAQAADAQVQALAGNPATSDALYGLSADVFEKIVKETSGDPQKMQEIIAQAKTNPAAFYQRYFGAQDKAKLQDLSRSIATVPGGDQAAPSALSGN